MSRTNGNSGDSEKCVAVLHKYTEEKPNLKGDRLNFILLIILYVIQGFPVGLTIAFSIILQDNKTITYSEQAIFSIASWAYILKIFWAPVVDALYVQWIGRRKSWLLPLQILMGSFLMYAAGNIDNWLPEKTKRPNLVKLLLVAFVLNSLSAFQDIVVDGWSLTMLKKKNVCYSSTCNSVGMPIGMFIGSVCFILLVSKDFANKFVRSEPEAGGLMTMQSCLYIWVIVIFSVTTITGIFKIEKCSREYEFEKISIIQSYKLLWDILKLPRIQVLSLALLTARIGFSTTEAVSSFKLIDAGLSQDIIVLINSLMFAVKFVMPFFVSKYVTGPKPMSYYMRWTPFRLLWGFAFAALIYYTPLLIKNKDGNVDVPIYYYCILAFINLINEMLSIFMLLLVYSFFCRLSDPQFGGTYMTLYNTFFYMGWLVPYTFALKMVDLLTLSQCSNDNLNICSTIDLKQKCVKGEGNCIVIVDGYYISMVVCITIGLVWYYIFRNIIRNYQSLGPSHWMIHLNRSNTGDVKEPCIISTA